MKNEIKKHIIDVVQAAEELQNFVQGMDFNAYQKNSVVQRAVERNFEIIGEALNRIKRIDDELIEQISEHRRIISFRNVLIHGYDIIDEKIVWDAIVNHLPLLLKEINELD